MFKLRDGEAQDLGFIMHSFLKRYRDAVNPRLISDKQYYESQHAVVTKILQSANLEVKVACDPEDSHHIYGYVIAEHLTPDWVMVHWVYVKGAFRRFGLAKALLSTVIGSSNKIHYSHRTKLIEVLDKNRQAAFCPQYVWALLDL